MIKIITKSLQTIRTYSKDAKYKEKLAKLTVIKEAREKKLNEKLEKKKKALEKNLAEKIVKNKVKKETHVKDMDFNKISRERIQKAKELEKERKTKREEIRKQKEWIAKQKEKEKEEFNKIKLKLQSKKKDPNLPVKSKSAFAWYLTQNSSTLKSQFDEKNLPITQFLKFSHDSYKNLSEEEKKVNLNNNNRPMFY
jgi:hypothetical protein